VYLPAGGNGIKFDTSHVPRPAFAAGRHAFTLSPPSSQEQCTRGIGNTATLLARLLCLKVSVCVFVCVCVSNNHEKMTAVGLEVLYFFGDVMRQGCRRGMR